VAEANIHPENTRLSAPFWLGSSIWTKAEVSGGSSGGTV
jgi:hypothetical protein